VLCQRRRQRFHEKHVNTCGREQLRGKDSGNRGVRSDDFIAELALARSQRVPKRAASSCAFPHSALRRSPTFYRNPPRVITSSSVARRRRSCRSRFGFSARAFFVSAFWRFAFAERCFSRVCRLRGESSTQRRRLLPVWLAAHLPFRSPAGRLLPQPIAPRTKKAHSSAETQWCFMSSNGGERVKGIEPSYAAWEAAVLPLNYTRGRDSDFGLPVFDWQAAKHDCRRRTVVTLSISASARGTDSARNRNCPADRSLRRSGASPAG
jgi:hypothetical protein